MVVDFLRYGRLLAKWVGYLAYTDRPSLPAAKLRHSYRRRSVQKKTSSSWTTWRKAKSNVASFSTTTFRSTRWAKLGDLVRPAVARLVTVHLHDVRWSPCCLTTPTSPTHFELFPTSPNRTDRLRWPVFVE